MNFPTPVLIAQVLIIGLIAYLVGRLAQTILDIKADRLHITTAPLFGLSLLAFQLWLYGIIGVDWNPAFLLLPWAAGVVLCRKSFLTSLYLERRLFTESKNYWRSLDLFERLLVFFGSLIAGLFLVQLVSTAFYSSDVFAIWGLKSKEFFSHQAVSVSPQFYKGEVMSRLLHVEYPPIYPLMVDVGYTLFGHVNEELMKGISFIFLLSGVGSMAVLLQSINDRLVRRLVLPATFIVLAAPQFLPFLFDSQYMGYADYGLGMVMLCGSLFLLRASFASSDWFFSLYFAVVAALFKNEGLGFLAGTCLVLGFLFLQSLRHGHIAKKELLKILFIVLVLATPIIVWWQFKHAHNMKIDFRLQNLRDSGLSAPARMRVVLWEVIKFIHTSEWQLWQVAALTLGFMAGLWSRHKQALTLIAVLGMQLAAYLTSYVLSPFDVHYHVFTSFDRLLVQILPLSVLLLVIGLRRPSSN